MRARAITVKTSLWAIIGMLSVVTAVRFIRGLGAATALSDVTPWGFWISFDVMAGVALAAGGFVMAGTVYILGRREYQPFARPAILTAFLGYAAVVMGLLYDLGLPWNIWHPIVTPQPHSVLFEVAMCVMLYLGVLFLEFGPVILERPSFDRSVFRGIHALLKRLSIPLVISGIVLSTLHQSSLGSLFLIAPHRLHPLWYSPIIWVLFFVSAVGLGLMMVIAESFFSSWLFGHQLRMKQLAGLGKAAAVVLSIYAALRIGDLAVRGVIGRVFDGSWQSYLFLFELLLSALIPATLLASQKIRMSPAGLGLCSGMTVFGMIGYRFDTCVVAFMRPENMPYRPSWMEVAVSVGIVAGGMLIFIFFVEKLRVYPAEEENCSNTESQPLDRQAYHPASPRMFLPQTLAHPRRYTLAAIVAAALTISFIPHDALVGSLVARTPVLPPRAMAGLVREHESPAGRQFRLAVDSTQADERPTSFMIIDGNRDGRIVLFPHDIHIETLGKGDSCSKCHHRNMPFDEQSSCYECHRDMYVVTDIFDHSLHIERLGRNAGCERCHADRKGAKNRGSAAACATCHERMIVRTSTIAEPADGMRGYASGYMQAMHGLCINCHRETARRERSLADRYFDQCKNCHRDSNLFRPESMEPYTLTRGVE